MGCDRSLGPRDEQKRTPNYGAQTRPDFCNPLSKTRSVAFHGFPSWGIYTARIRRNKSRTNVAKQLRPKRIHSSTGKPTFHDPSDLHDSHRRCPVKRVPAHKLFAALAQAGPGELSQSNLNGSSQVLEGLRWLWANFHDRHPTSRQLRSKQF